MTRPGLDHPNLVQIGVIAERVGLSLRSVRYYEELGLVTPSARSEGGFRLYGPVEEERLRVIKTMKPLGFTLDDMRDLISLLDDAATVRPGSRRAQSIQDRIAAVRLEIQIRRTNLLDQIEATTLITKALDQAGRHLA